MNRFHVHVHVTDLARSVAFYSSMFDMPPTRLESDYAKWMVGEGLNFAISARGGAPGVDHLGFQVDSDEALAEMKARARAADMTLLAEGETQCCYARSDKYWLTDPDGIAWEQFRTLDSIPTFGRSGTAASLPAAACCPSDTAKDAPADVATKAGAASCC